MLPFLVRHPPVAIIFATLALNMVGFGIVLPLLPVLIKHLGGSPLAMSLMVTGWAATQFVAAPFWGNLSDRVGRRPILMTGIAGLAIAFAMLAFADSVSEAILSRMVGGLLSAATLPAAQAYLADVTPASRRAQAMAAAGAAFGLGFLLGPMVGAALAALGLRAAFLASAALSVANLLGVAWLLPEPAHRETRTVPARADLGFLWQQRHQPWAVYLYALFLVAFCASGLFSMLGLFVLDRLRLPESLTGIPFTVQGLASVVVQFVLLEPALRRMGDHGSMVVACLVGAAGFGLLALSRNLWQVCVGVAAAATSLSVVRPTVASAVSVRSHLPHGLVMGMQTASDALGRALGPVWAGVVYRCHPSWPFGAAAVISLLTAGMLAAAGSRHRASGQATAGPTRPPMELQPSELSERRRG